MELDDLAYHYEDITRLEQPQRYLASKKEFSTLSSTVGDRTPIPGEYYKYQEEVNRLLQHYDRLLMRWDPGVGKTCGMTAAAEWWHRQADNGGHIRRCFAVVRSKLLKEELRHQIVCRCTDRLYNQVSPDLESQLSINRAVNVNVRAWWGILTLEKFASELQSVSNEDLITKYSNTMIILDEAQNLALEPGKVDMSTIREQIRNYVPPAVDPTGKKAKIEKNDIFLQMMRLTHLPKAIKVILMTATPMINSPNEIVSVMNLVLPEDRLITGGITHLTSTQLRNIFRGYVSRIRQAVSGVRVQRNGRRLPFRFLMSDGRTIESQFPVVPVVMTGLQAQTYALAFTNPGAFRDTDQRDAVRNLEQQSATWVYPGPPGLPRGLIAEEGLDYNAPATAGKRNPLVQDHTPTDAFRVALTRHLGEMSAVINQIITQTLPLPGIDWIYLKYIPAVVALYLALNLRGVELYTPTSSEFISTGRQQVGYCLTKGDEIRTIRPDFPRRPRMIIIDNAFNNNIQKRNWVMEVLNSPENRHGEYIKYVIGTPLSREGISLFNVRRSHYTPAWNRTLTTQAEGRANRGAPGFEALLDEQRKAGVANPEVVTEINAYAAVLNLDIFNHSPIDIAVPRGATLTPQGLGINTGSVDLDMYLTSEVKDIEIKAIERLMDESALDCAIQYLKNIPRPGELVAGSSACAYDSCEYRCMDFDGPITPEVMATFGSDKSSYLALYSGQAIRELTPVLKTIFTKITDIRFSDLVALLKTIVGKDVAEERFLILTLIEFFRNRYPVTNVFGLPNYLYLVHDRVFLANSFENTDSVATSYYSKGLIAVANGSLTKFLEKQERPDKDRIKREFMTITNNAAGDAIISQVAQSDQVEMFEAVLVELINKRPLTAFWQRYLYEQYSRYVYQFHEPQEEIRKYERLISDRAKARGHPVKVKDAIVLSKLYPKNFDGFIFQTDTPPVYVHRLLQRFEAQKPMGSYNVVARFFNDESHLRIYKPSADSGFRDPSNVEKPAYAALVQMSVRQQVAPFFRHDIFGIVLRPDLRFRIVDHYGRARSEDKREDIRGENCQSIKRDRFYDILWHLRLMPVDLANTPVPPIAEIRNYLRNHRKKLKNVESFSDEKATFVYRYLVSKISHGALCDMIQYYMKQNNMIYYE